jgi:hypothetical protein
VLIKPGRAEKYKLYLIALDAVKVNVAINIPTFGTWENVT